MQCQICKLYDSSGGNGGLRFQFKNDGGGNFGGADEKIFRVDRKNLNQYNFNVNDFDNKKMIAVLLRRLSRIYICLLNNRRRRLIFLCLFEEHIIDDNRDFDNLKCQHCNLVFSHDYHLPSRRKPTTDCLLQRKLYKQYFQAVEALFFCADL